MGEMNGKVAVVTGASRGGGKGIALVLGEQGATVYVTGRSMSNALNTPDWLPGSVYETAEEITRRGGKGIPVQCDHGNDAEIEWLFERVKRIEGQLDLLVNNAWGGYENYISDASFCAPFWEQPISRFDKMVKVGLRSHLVTTRYALPLMFKQSKGLVVNTTTNLTPENDNCSLFYWVIKNSINLMTRKMAQQLNEYEIAVVALAPDWMNTERMNPTEENLKEMENVELSGRVVTALALDPDVMNKTGLLVRTRLLAKEYGLTDTGGEQPGAAVYKEFRI